MARDSVTSLSKMRLRNSKQLYKFVWKTFIPNCVQIGLKMQQNGQISIDTLTQAVSVTTPTATRPTATERH
jgi:hypothetical protein